MSVIYATVTVTVTAAPAPPSTSTSCAIYPGGDSYSYAFGILHLLPPYQTPIASSGIINTTEPETILFESPCSPTSISPFPNGAAPLPPLPIDPLGLSSLSVSYSPGITILLLGISLATVLRFFMKDQLSSQFPGADVTKDPYYHSIRKLILANIWSTYSDLYPLLQFVALLWLNIAGFDLLYNFVLIERDWNRMHANPTAINGTKFHDERSWMSYAGHLGPPITILTWGVLTSAMRVILCLVGLSSINGLQIPHLRLAYSRLIRSLVLDYVGLLVPLTSLSI
jgi:hypothetical protein